MSDSTTVSVRDVQRFLSMSVTEIKSPTVRRSKAETTANRTVKRDIVPADPSEPLSPEPLTSSREEGRSLGVADDEI